MNHVFDLSDVHLQQPSLLTIGVFDGMHTGHQALINRLVEKAHSSDRLAVVLTFFPHPDIVLRGLKGRYYLTTPEQRAEIMNGLGVDCVVTHPFNDSVRHIRASEFVDQLITHLKMSALWVGADFAMGYKREGNVEFLRAQGHTKGFSVETIDLIAHETNGIISSTSIRELLTTGHVEPVHEWLGRGYSMVGEVTHGEKRGRTIGFPTANIAVWDEQVIPANGVYAGWARLKNERFMAVTNIGMRPTFNGERVTVEAHLLDFDRDIYGQTLEVTFETRMRSEQKFTGIDTLIAQIQKDVVSGREYLQRTL